MVPSTIPQRPRKVTLALYMLYISLGISVIEALATWLRFGPPGATGYFLLNIVIMIAALLFHALPSWEMHGSLLPVLIAPLAVWLYYMIGKGKNWARTTLLVLVILQFPDFIRGVAISLSFLQLSGPTLSLIDFLPSLLILQIALQMAAATLLYARVSSDWFFAVRSCSEQPRIKGRGRIIKLRLGLLGLLIVGVLVLTFPGSDYIITWKINAFFKEISASEPKSHYDLREVIPEDWEEVCIVYFQYISPENIEKKIQGKLVVPEKFFSEDGWMVLGINGKREITQVLLDREVRVFLGDNFSGASWQRNCVPREQAALTWITQNGKRYLKLGNP